MLNITQKPATDVTTLCLRPDKGNWGAIILLAIIGGAPLLLTHKAPLSIDIMVGLLAVLLLVPALVFGYWQTRAVIIADEEGLRWRGFGGWRMAHWADVSDYYEQLIGKSKPALIIKTGLGRVYISPGLWTVTPELRTFIEQQATEARTKEWGLSGMRPEADWPRTFDYNTADNRFQNVLLPMTGLIVTVYLLWIVSPGAVRAAASLGWGWGLATFAIGSLGILPVGLLLAVCFRNQHATRRRKHHRLTLTQSGVLYENENSRIETPWQEITDLHFARGKELGYRCVVVSKQGVFEFSPSIKDSAVLRRALSKFATTLPEAKWRTTETDVLGEKTARWTSRCEGVGRRIYHYRTRTIRALLWFPTAIAIVIAAIHWGLAPLGLAPANTGMLLCYSVLTLWGWWRYAAAGIEIDDNGITQRTLFGTRTLAWDDVTDYGKSGGDAFVFGVLKSAKSHLWFWMGIGDVSNLKDEIQRHALNSRRHTWDKDAYDE